MYIIKRTVLFGDCDPAGYIYTPRVTYYVVEAVNEFLSSILGGSAIRKIIELGVLPPARALSIEFTAPIKWDDVLEIKVAIKDISKHSFTFSVVALNKEEVKVFIASFTQVCVSPETKKPVEIPAELKNALNENIKT